MCNFVLSFEFTCNLVVSHTCKLTIADEEDLRILRSEQFQIEDDFKGVWDGKERRLVPAPPLPRSSLSHRHVAAETEYVESLPENPIPKELQDDIDDHDRFLHFNPWREKSTYRDRLHNLLWIEEAAEIKAMRRFDLAAVSFELHRGPLPGCTEIPDGTLHVLIIEKLAERRPSVLLHDRLIAWAAVGDTDVEFEAWVFHVGPDRIYARFDPSFDSGGRPFHVRFTYDRLSMRQLHRAVDRCSLDIMWPDRDAAEHRAAAPAAGRVRERPADLGDVLGGLDEEQRAAVHAACERREQLLRGAKQAPFLLRGPFGCGKTRTLVACVRAALRLEPAARILVCAEANAVADEICKALARDAAPAEMLRFNAFFRSRDSLAPGIEPYCCFSQDQRNAFAAPSLAQLLTYRVVVSTAGAAATLFGVGVGDTHFTHVLIDECAQMTEPAALAPLCLAGPSTLVVLCGDELQSGPVVRSPSARHHGLHESLMERLARHTHAGLYGPPDGAAAAARPLARRLLSNYRSHPGLLALPSALFYGSALRAAGSAAEIRSLSTWEGLPSPGFPMLFVGVEGEDVRDEASPSFYNELEAIEVKRQVLRLVTDTGIPQKDVAVIAPYKAQIVRVRRLLRSCGLNGVEVGPPAVLQGRESRAVFVSTVRAAGSQYLDLDRDCHLGLLQDPK